MTSSTDSKQGGCLCGGVRYQVNGPLRPVVACHCGQCRRTSGHYVAATAVRWEDLDIQDSGTLRWYESSPGIRRGFCHICGSSLFWDNPERSGPSIMAGTLDSPTGLSTAVHIHMESRGDYYNLPYGEPVQEGGSHPYFTEA